MQISDIRSIILQALTLMKDDLPHHGGSLQISTIIKKVAEIATAQGFPFNDRDQKHQLMLLEVVNELMNQGVIMWGIGTDGDESGPPWLSITTYGNEVLKAGEFIPHDYDGYLSYFNQENPNSDPIIQMYLSESLQTYFSRNYLAASVMLGVASEAAFDVLFNTMTTNLTGPKKAKFERLQKELSIKKRFDELMKELQLIKNQLPYEIKENIESTPKGIFDLIRYQRNDSGHPTGKPVKQKIVYANLQLFVMYCKFLYAIVDWLNKNAVKLIP